MNRMRQIAKLGRLYRESYFRYLLTHNPRTLLGTPFDIPFIPKNKIKRVKNRLHRKGII